MGFEWHLSYPELFSRLSATNCRKAKSFGPVIWPTGYPLTHCQHKECPPFSLASKYSASSFLDRSRLFFCPLIVTLSALIVENNTDCIHGDLVLPEALHSPTPREREEDRAWLHRVYKHTYTSIEFLVYKRPGELERCATSRVYMVISFI